MKQNDYFDDDVPENLKEVMRTKGVHRAILEVQNLKAVTELCIKATENLKWQNFNNIIFLILGWGLSTLTSVATNQEINQLKNKVMEKETEIIRLKHQSEKHLHVKPKSLKPLQEKSK